MNTAGAMNGARPPGLLAVAVALTRGLRTLRAPRMWAYVLGPALVSLILWLVLATYWMGPAIEWLVGVPPLSWLAAWGWVAVARFVAAIAVWLAILVLTYLTATVVASTVVLPLVLTWLSSTEYPDLARMGDDSAIASLANSLAAVVVYLGLCLLSLPLWLVPGLGLVLPALLLAGLNRRTFSYDALALHATRDEWRELRARHGNGLFVLGLVLALLAHIPLVGLLVPTLCVVAYIHYALEALRQSRQGAIINASAVVVDGH